MISLWVSVPRLLIQIGLAIWLAMKFNIFFYLMFTIIELFSQLSHTIKYFYNLKSQSLQPHKKANRHNEEPQENR